MKVEFDHGRHARPGQGACTGDRSALAVLRSDAGSDTIRL